MSVTFLNDWKYLFNADSFGGRFANFTLLNISYLKESVLEDLPIGGLCIIILGLGIRITRGI